MKALVLEGCTGLLGQALRHVLLGRGWSVESLERSDGDILDADFLQARLDSCAPDVVFSSLGWNTVDAFLLSAIMGKRQLFCRLRYTKEKIFLKVYHIRPFRKRAACYF